MESNCLFSQFMGENILINFNLLFLLFSLDKRSSKSSYKINEFISIKVYLPTISSMNDYHDIFFKIYLIDKIL